MIADAAPARTRDLLRWLRRLRWMAACGQAAAMAFAAGVLKLDLPWPPLLIGLCLTVAANHFLPTDAGKKTTNRRPLVLALVVDTLLLTLMLYWTGGAHNPFVAFYLLFVALAAMMLRARGLAVVSLVCAAAFAWISFHHVPFEGPPDLVTHGLLAYPIHRAGSVVALVLVGLFLGIFVHRMQETVVSRELALMEAEQRATDTERFKSLATLAAGVAHELGSPLGTIAVASKELERSLAKEHPSGDLLEDARLIRSEVDRCRAILGRLDRRTTGGTGSPPVTFTTGMFGEALAPRLSKEFASRLVVLDNARNASLQLSLEPVLQALVVLIENACEADPSEKPVHLEIRIADADVVFRVLDSGKGMTDEIRRRAGEPYFTTKAADGTGLGLFLVRTLAMQLGGDVSLHPRADGGTAAILTLPANRTPEP